MGVVLTIPEASVDYVLYGDNRQTVATYLSNQLSQLPSHFNEFGNRMIETVKRTYNYLTDELLHRTIQNKAQQVSAYLDNAGIYACNSFDELQNASVSMQRWIMANPNLRKVYLAQNCDGYSNTYVNLSKTDIGQTHYDYRRVMHGIPVSTDTGFNVHFYDEDLELGDRKLSHLEVKSILTTWETIDLILGDTKFDFTNTDALVKRGE
jgi:hypothetical protein